jgi:hypothetical protein
MTAPHFDQVDQSRDSAVDVEVQQRRQPDHRAADQPNRHHRTAIRLGGRDVERAFLGRVADDVEHNVEEPKSDAVLGAGTRVRALDPLDPGRLELVVDNVFAVKNRFAVCTMGAPEVTPVQMCTCCGGNWVT